MIVTQNMVLRAIEKYFFGARYPDAEEMEALLKHKGVDINETWRKLQEVLTKIVKEVG